MLRLVFLCFLVVGACLAGPVAQSGLIVRVWQSQDGLPGNVVRSVVQSDDGFLWVATAEGLARFDGLEFELIEPERGLRRRRLSYSRLFATGGGNVWAATFQGALFRVRGGRFEQILKSIPRPGPPVVTQVIEDSEGVVFYRRGEETGRIADDGSVVVLAAADVPAGLFEKDLEQRLAGGRFVEAGRPPVLVDSGGCVWSAEAAGSLTVKAEGRSPVTMEFPGIGNAFGVGEMLADREGNVWLASPANGLARIRQARVDVPEIAAGANERSFTALMEDRSGVWWIASRNSELIRWSGGETKVLELPGSRPVAALFEDRDKQLWVASRDGSVFLRENDGFLPGVSKSRFPSKVRAITQDAGGAIWFGGAQGLAMIENGEVRRIGGAEGLPGNLDYSVLQPFPGGRIIAGSATGGVFLGGRKGFKAIAAPEVMNHQWISGILPISEKEVWISTLGSGLFLWNGKIWRSFGVNDGLPDSRLTCVLDDGRGYLWMGSLGGIIRAGKKDLMKHLHAPDRAVNWLRLDHSDGLPSRECIGGLQPAGWKARDGTLWFPTGGGIAKVDPALLALTPAAPPVHLRSVRSNGVAHPAGSRPVIAGPGRARLEFRFMGLNFSAPEKTTYRARLTGLDDSWRELGNQRVAAFEAVPPGDYRFEVVAVNGDGVPSSAPARVSVIVKPHLWETSWFYLTVGAVVLSGAAGVGWFAARVRMRRRIQLLGIQNAREGERSRIARDLHDDLGASLTEISILAALAAEDAEKTPLQTPLSQLSAKAKHVVGSLDEIVWAVNPREDTLRSLVDYLAAFAREFLDIAGIPLRLDVTQDITGLALAAPTRHGVFLAAREALNNIAKHSGATEAHLRIAVSANLLEIRISDNGRGFEPDSAKGGNGLHNLQTRMQEAGGGCRIESHHGQGSSVYLTLPLPASTKPVF